MDTYKNFNNEYQGAFLSAYEVSSIFGIPLDSVYYLSRKGKIKAIKIGKHWKYKKVDIEQCLNNGTDFCKKPAIESNNLKDVPPNYIEQRSFQRINTNFKCFYYINLPPLKQIKNEGIIKNLSGGGIFLLIQSNGLNGIDLDDPIELDFVLNSNVDQSINIYTKGKAIRKNKNGIGIRFRHIDKQLQDRIVEYAN